MKYILLRAMKWQNYFGFVIAIDRCSPGRFQQVPGRNLMRGKQSVRRSLVVRFQGITSTLIVIMNEGYHDHPSSKPKTTLDVTSTATILGNPWYQSPNIRLSGNDMRAVHIESIAHQRHWYGH